MWEAVNQGAHEPVVRLLPYLTQIEQVSWLRH